MKRVKTMICFVLLLFLAGCGERDVAYQPILERAPPVGLSGAVALRDDQRRRLLFLTADQERKLHVESVPAGRNVAAAVAAADGDRLFVLSRGVLPRLSEDDEGPKLSVYRGGADKGQRLEKEFSLDDPMQNLALDPQGKWVGAYGGDSTVINPNQLVLFDLSSGKGVESEPLSKTIRSFGGSPIELLFAEELEVPEGGKRRLLIVRTDRDVTLVDLENLERSEVTVKLPVGDDGQTQQPEQIVYDDGDPDDATDARLAIRLKDSSDVVLVQLGRPDRAGKDFSVVVNIVDVGGEPSWIDFVRTDGGLRLAALVPGASRAVLVNPENTLSEAIQLPHPISRMRRITTDVADAPAGGDVALLWGASKSIAFWSLGNASATPYRSVSSTELSFTVTEVLDVPAPNAHLKVLLGQSSDVFVLDLKTRQSFPLHTKLDQGRVAVSPDGQRLWIYDRLGSQFSSVDLPELRPKALFVEARMSAIFDIAARGGERAAVVLHMEQSWGATLFDAQRPDSAQSIYFPALYLRND